MQTTTTDTPRATGKARTLDLDERATMDGDALARLYAEGTVTDVSPLAGRPTGRMLAVRGLDHGGVASLIRGFAGSRAFPWGGKSMSGTGRAGSGVNRVHLGGR